MREVVQSSINTPKTWYCFRTTNINWEKWLRKGEEASTFKCNEWKGCGGWWESKWAEGKLRKFSFSFSPSPSLSLSLSHSISSLSVLPTPPTSHFDSSVRQIKIPKNSFRIIIEHSWIVSSEYCIFVSEILPLAGPPPIPLQSHPLPNSFHLYIRMRNMSYFLFKCTT